MFLSEFWNILILSAPYLIFGLIVSGFIHVFFQSTTIKKIIGKEKIKDIFLASLLGVPIPLCSCSVIPTAITLRKKGASNGATSSFLISSPESGVDSILLTYSLMDIPMSIFRVVATFFSAFTAGILNIFFNKTPKQVIEQEEKSCCSEKNNNKENNISKNSFSIWKKIKDGFLYSFRNLMDDISFWLLFGLLIASIISFYVPENFFNQLSNWQNKGLILLVGIPLYICASATTPIASSMILKGLNPGSALLLLLVGPATNIANLLVMKKYISTKGIVINLVSIIVVAVFFSFLIDYFYLNYFSIDFNLKSHLHNENPSYFENFLASILLFLMLKGIFKKCIYIFFKKGKA